MKRIVKQFFLLHPAFLSGRPGEDIQAVNLELRERK